MQCPREVAVFDTGTRVSGDETRLLVLHAGVVLTAVARSLSALSFILLLGWHPTVCYIITVSALSLSGLTVDSASLHSAGSLRSHAPRTTPRRASHHICVQPCMPSRARTAYVSLASPLPGEKAEITVVPQTRRGELTLV